MRLCGCHFLDNRRVDAANLILPVLPKAPDLAFVVFGLSTRKQISILIRVSLSKYNFVFRVRHCACPTEVQYLSVPVTEQWPGAVVFIGTDTTMISINYGFTVEEAGRTTKLY
eukprot:3370994-Rhodomonas_salina.1